MPAEILEAAVVVAGDSAVGVARKVEGLHDLDLVNALLPVGQVLERLALDSNICGAVLEGDSRLTPDYCAVVVASALDTALRADVRPCSREVYLSARDARTRSTENIGVREADIVHDHVQTVADEAAILIAALYPHAVYCMSLAVDLAREIVV